MCANVKSFLGMLNISVIGGRNARTVANMKRRREIVRILENHPNTPVGRAGRARKTTKRDGVCMSVECAWVPPNDDDDNWVFGPDPLYDNIYQCVPQVSSTSCIFIIGC